MKKVNIVGNKYIHLFRRISDGVLLEVPITETEYRALGLPGASPATKNDYEWVNSHERILFDNPSGDIEDGQYVDTQDGKVFFKEKGKEPKVGTKDDIKDK